MVTNPIAPVTSNAVTLNVTVPPTFTTPPVSQSVNAGANAVLSVTASGATSYQWQLNGANISRRDLGDPDLEQYRG